MLIEHEGRRPEIAEGAYVAPNAVVRGDVVIREGAAVLFGAVLTAEGGRVEVGQECVVMEHAVLRGTPRDPLALGGRTLVGPRSHLTGCRVEPGCFLATGSTVFNGARVGAGSEVRINGVVHVNSRLPAGTVVPIGWVAVGDPAEVLPPGEHDRIWAIQRTLDFPGTVFRSERGAPEAERIRRYARALQRQKEDRILPDSGPAV
ncbi:MAG TPA: gamma carbonic anhydrase family protein [Gemmatimonadota bacterium]|nr:gamma carbonic anhydrase family protein [Gemmatimonadota bacterium]